MKRDWSLIRDVLLHVEAHDDFLLNTDDAPRCYALGLSIQAGYVVFREHHPKWPYSLAPAGRDFLDVIRDDAVWSNLSDLIAAFGGMPTDLLIQAARAMPHFPEGETIGFGSFSDVGHDACSVHRSVIGLGLDRQRVGGDGNHPMHLGPHLR